MDSKRKRQHDVEPEGMKSHKKAKNPSASRSIIPGLAAGSEMTTAIKNAGQFLEPDDFQNLITTVLLPVAEASLTQEQKDNVMLAFSALIAEYGEEEQNEQAIALVDYNRYTSILRDSVSSLKLSVRSHDVYDEQKDMTNKLVRKIMEWSKKLFRVGIEMQVHFELVHKSLMAIKSIIDDAYRANCKLDFPGDVNTLKSSTGEEMYLPGSVEDLLSKLWRDLLLVAISKGGNKNMRFVKTAIESFDWDARVAVKDLLSDYVDHEHLDNVWHTPEMMSSVPRLEALRIGKKDPKLS